MREFYADSELRDRFISVVTSSMAAGSTLVSAGNRRPMRAADAEAVGLSHFAGVDNEAPVVEAIAKFVRIGLYASKS